MNFFDAQDRARRATRWLVIVYLAATIVIVAAVTALVAFGLYWMGQPRPVEPSLLAATAVASALLILGATAYKTAVLSVGGSRVATDMGGTLVAPDTSDPLKKRLRNVVEEMSIASGVPVPEIYVLDAEQGINAFAAGYTPGDAAIAVTRGALETLDRDELQGVIAHEFSHILNGDMRLNIRMMGVLFGIMVLGLIGRVVLRGSLHGRAVSRDRRRGAPAVLAIGLGLVILGWIGVLFARIIKAAISRKRESLADASAVQFTRQTEGLAGALKKIGGYRARSYIRAVDPEEVSHMLFSFGRSGLASLFATHPPLVERIQALDPTFREEEFARVVITEQRGATEPAGAAVHAFAAAAPAPAAVAASMGQPDQAQLDLARGLRSGIPEALYQAAHAPDQAFLLALALGLDRSGHHTPRQLELLHRQLGGERASAIERLHAQLTKLGPRYHLALLDLAFPTLKRRPPEQLEFLADLARRLIEMDGRIELYEYCFWRVLSANLEQAVDPSRFGRGNRVSKKAARDAAVKLVRIVAWHGSDDPARRENAYEAGLSAFGRWAGAQAAPPTVSGTVAELDACLDVLQRINMSGRQTLVQALTATILHDGKLDVAETELLRAICAALQCPLPPIITAGE